MGLDTVELVLATEKHFSIYLPDDEVANIETVESFCKLVQEKCIYKDGLKAISYNEIYSYLVNVLHSEFSVPLKKIHPGSRFVKDLGLD